VSILAKYSLWLLGILAVAVGCITGASLVYQEKSLTREAILRGQSLAYNLAAPAADALLGHDNLTLISLATNATRDNQGLVYAAILNARGNVVGHPDQRALLKPLDFQADGGHPYVGGRATVLTGHSAGRPVWDISVPVRLNGSKRVLGSAHVGLDRSVVATAIKASLVGLGAIGVIIMILGVGLAFLALEVLVEPLRELSKASEAVGRGDFGVSVAVRGNDEVGHLSANFNSMVAGLKSAETAKLEQGRIEGELSMARAIQFDLLLDQPPSVKGLDIAFTCLPAKELGGDFYDCIPLENGSWGFLIADVSGKGVPAALHMTNMRNLFRIFAPSLSSPLETLKKINAMAFMDMKTEAFVTLIYIVLDPKTRQASMVNAGHDPAYWLNENGITALPSTAPPVGLAPPGDYDVFAHEVAFTLAKGDSLFTFTDGVTEAMNPKGEQFSLDRLKLSLAKGGNSDEAMQRLLAAVTGHAAGREQRDDITMLTVKVA
jgi:serine phosphatase RsbU (regulator of sigma subunit)